MKKNKKKGISWVMAASIAAYAMIAIASDIFANKQIDFGFLGLTAAGGILLMPFAFTIRDLMHTLIGYENSKKVVWSVAILNLFMALMMILLDNLHSPIPGADEAWHAIMGSSWRIILASFLGQVSAQLTNTYIFDKFLTKYGNKKLGLASISSNMAATLFDTVLFTLIAFLGVLPGEVLVSMIVTGFIMKFVISAIATPLVYLGKYKLLGESIGEVE